MLRLRMIREGKGVSLRALKKRSGVAVATLARIEAGGYDPRLSTLMKLAKALGVTVWELIGEATLSVAEEIRKGRAMASGYSVQRKDKAVVMVVDALEKWRRQYVKKGLKPNIWEYEYEQVDDAIDHLKKLMVNLKGPDSRARE